MPPSAPALPCSWIKGPQRWQRRVSHLLAGSGGVAGQGCCALPRQARRAVGEGEPRLGGLRLLAHPHAPLPARLSVLQCNPGRTAEPPQGRLTDSTLLGHTHGARHTVGAAACPGHASTCSQPVSAAVSAATPPLKPVPGCGLNIPCTLPVACILCMPFRISPNASVALLISSLASRSSSSDPPTAPGWQRACLQGVQHSGRAAWHHPSSLAGTPAACSSGVSSVRLQQVWELDWSGQGEGRIWEEQWPGPILGSGDEQRADSVRFLLAVCMPAAKRRRAG